jgi:uracil phosphoribosyltransferase
MSVTVIEHPLVNHKLGVLRDESTPPWVFRQMIHELSTIAGVEATKHLTLTPTRVHTPVAEMDGARLAAPGALIVPILRAGIAMLDSFLALIPTSEVGFFGTKRNEHTLVPDVYMDRVPADLSRRHVFVIDPMLATGGSMSVTLEHLHARGATDITSVCLVSAPEGVSAVENTFERLGVNGRLVVAVIDRKLNDKGYIVPGLGDAGDRLFGAY